MLVRLPAAVAEKQLNLFAALILVKALCHFALGFQFCLSVGVRSTWVAVAVVGGVIAAKRRIKDLA